MSCVLILLSTLLVVTCYGQLYCSDYLKREPLKYYPLRHCQRSTEYQIARKNVANLEKCAEFAEKNFALAFNYGHGRKPKNESVDHNLINLFDKPAANQSIVDDSDTPVYVNCEILACPEIGNLSTIINDTRYDYYTLYANPIREFNRSMRNRVSGLSLFFFSTSKRYLLANRWIIYLFVWKQPQLQPSGGSVHCEWGRISWCTNGDAIELFILTSAAAQFEYDHQCSRLRNKFLSVEFDTK